MYLIIYTGVKQKESARNNIIKIFETIPDRPSPQFRSTVPVFNSTEGLGVLALIKDSSPVKELFLSFNVPLLDSKRSKSIDYITNMLLRSQDRKDFCNR